MTPACGYIGVGGALIIGVVAGLAGLWGVTMLKRLLRVDDPAMSSVYTAFAVLSAVS